MSEKRVQEVISEYMSGHKDSAIEVVTSDLTVALYIAMMIMPNDELLKLAGEIIGEISNDESLIKVRKMIEFIESAD